ncbi:hypothetical protein [Salinimicrobium soli]|uniref:hypothetical protein n=1 Tax=Salinimicrobium soli TaxID=1254399 RepID=UPI003AAC91F0
MKPEIIIDNYGTSLENPVLLSSIRTGYNYCDKLQKLDEDLEYRRRGSNLVAGFEKPVDAYDFKRFGKDFCTVYIYAYHSEDIEEVPAPFFRLDEGLSTLDNWLEELEIRETEENGGNTEELLEAMFKDELEDPPSEEELLGYLVSNILIKHGKNAPASDEESGDWSPEDERRLVFQIHELGLSPLLEPVVLQEWEDYLKNTHRPHREFFVHSFLPSYHHSKLEPYLPQETREKNEQVKKAYVNLVQVINRIQFFADEEVQERVESDLQKKQETLTVIKQCNTRFCGLRLHSDFSGRCNIDYWLDLDILKMLNKNPVSTLLRSIYELTPGLEERVSCRSLTYDCEAWFEDLREESRYEEEYRLIIAEHPY